MDAIAREHGYTVADVLGKSRRRRLVAVRHKCVFMLRAKKYSFKDIGRIMNRDHSTIIHAVNKDKMNAAKVAEGLSAMEQEWLTGWQGPEGTAYDTVATDLRQKGLLIGPFEWNLSPLGIAVRKHLKETKQP